MSTMPNEYQRLINLETYILKVNVNCQGCRRKVKKILRKIEGVYTVKIEADQQKVTVTGNVDPATLIKNLERSRKHAELLSPMASQEPSQEQHQTSQLNLKNKTQMQYLDNSAQARAIDQLLFSTLYGHRAEDESGYEGHTDKDQADGLENPLMNLFRNEYNWDGDFQGGIDHVIPMARLSGYQGYGGGSIGSEGTKHQRFRDYHARSPTYGYPQPSTLMMNDLMGYQYNYPYAATHSMREDPQGMRNKYMHIP